MAAFETGFLVPSSHVVMSGAWSNAANMYDANEATLCQQGIDGFNVIQIRFLIDSLADALPDGYTITSIQMRTVADHANAGPEYQMRLYNGGTVLSSEMTATEAASGAFNIVTITHTLDEWSSQLSGISFGDPAFAIGFALQGAAGAVLRFREISFNFIGTVPDEAPTETVLSHHSTAVVDGGTALNVVFANTMPPPFVGDPVPIEYRGGLPTLSSGSVLAPTASAAFFETAFLWGIEVVFPIDATPDFDFTASYDAEMLTWYTPENNTVFVSDAVVDQAVSWSIPSMQKRQRNAFRRVYDLMPVRNPSIPAGQSRRHLYGGQS